MTAAATESSARGVWLASISLIIKPLGLSLISLTVANAPLEVSSLMSPAFFKT